MLVEGKKQILLFPQRHPHAGRLGRGPGICSFTGTPGVFGGGGLPSHCRHTGEDLPKMGMKSGLQQAQGVSTPVFVLKKVSMCDGTARGRWWWGEQDADRVSAESCPQETKPSGPCLGQLRPPGDILQQISKTFYCHSWERREFLVLSRSRPEVLLNILGQLLLPLRLTHNKELSCPQRGEVKTLDATHHHPQPSPGS